MFPQNYMGHDKSEKSKHNNLGNVSGKQIILMVIFTWFYKGVPKTYIGIKEERENYIEQQEYILHNIYFRSAILSHWKERGKKEDNSSFLRIISSNNICAMLK